MTEHFVEDRLGERVEVREHLTPLGAQGVGMIEDRGNPALLAERRKRNREPGDGCNAQPREIGAGSPRCRVCDDTRLCQVMRQVSAIEMLSRANGKDVRTAHARAVWSADLP